MVYTLLLFVTRKPDISFADFKHHWETRHVPLLKSIVGNEFPLSYTRHYIERTDGIPDVPAILTSENVLFDALAVYTFANEAHFLRFWDKKKDPKNHEILVKDKDLFQDRAKNKAVFVGDSKSTGKDGGEAGWRFVASIS